LLVALLGAASSGASGLFSLTAVYVFVVASDTIIAGFQCPSDGDLAAPLSSAQDDRTAFRIASIDEPRTLVRSKPDSAWAWRLTSDGAGCTRLVTRLKARYDVGIVLANTG
jgi:hypothetical protein